MRDQGRYSKISPLTGLSACSLFYVGHLDNCCFRPVPSVTTALWISLDSTFESTKMASLSGPDFVISSGCSYCAKVDMKEYQCPGLAGRGRNLYNNLSGLPVHPQLINRSPCQCCSTSHQHLCPFPVRLNSLCNCPRCRRSQQDTIERRVPLPHHPPIINPCSSHWLGPVEVQNSHLSNTGFIPSTMPSQPCVPGHVGMATVNPVDNIRVNDISALSYHHHHHYHHYHYHPHTHARTTLHPYALPVLHPRLRRPSNSHRISRRNTEEDQVPHSILSILTPSRVTWEAALDAEQIEDVNFEEQFVDQKPRGLSKASVEKLPSYRITMKDKNIGESRCVVCLMDFEERQQVRILPCLHEYHTKCIDKWLKSNRTCPICRKEIKIS